MFKKGNQRLVPFLMEENGKIASFLFTITQDAYEEGFSEKQDVIMALVIGQHPLNRELISSCSQPSPWGHKVGIFPFL